jgi:hypothetical protein
MAEFAKLVGDADLAVSRLVERKLDGDRLDLGRGAVLEDRLSPRQFLQRQFAAGIIKLLETVKAVAAVAHHLAGLADIAELLCQLQQPKQPPGFFVAAPLIVLEPACGVFSNIRMLSSVPDLRKIRAGVASSLPACSDRSSKRALSVSSAARHPDRLEEGAPESRP